MNSTPSLSDLVFEHQKDQASRRKELDELQKSASISIKNLTTEITSSAAQEVSQVIAKQNELESATKKFVQQSRNLEQQVDLWMGLSDKLSSSIKELGDVENWAQVIEEEMSDIVSIIDSTMQQK